MKSIQLIVLMACMSLFSSISLAMNLEQATSTLVKLQSYTEHGGGDVIFTMREPGSVCKGYWLRKDSPGHQTTFSILLAAFQTDTPVSVYAHPEQHNRWNGSGTHFCKVYTVQYIKY